DITNELQDFYYYLHDFSPSIGREHPSVVKTTADTHKRVMTRFFEFISSNLLEIEEIDEKINYGYLCFTKPIISTIKNNLILSVIVLDLIKIFLQHLLDAGCGGHYL